MFKNSIGALVLICLPMASHGQSLLDYPELKKHADSCEAAYLLGDISKLSSSIAMYRSCMDTTKWKCNWDSVQQVGLGYKFMSNLAYLRADYVKSVELIDSAINYSYLQSTGTKLNIKIDKAQSLFMLHEYAGATELLKDVYNSDFKDSLFLINASAYALSLAYCGNFKEAKTIINSCQTSGYRTVLNDEQLNEIERRKAKILILEAESKDEPAVEDYKEAVALYREYYKKRKTEILSKFSKMTSREREGFWLTQRQFIADCYRLEQYAPDLVYDVALFNKNLLLKFSARNMGLDDCSWQDVRKGLLPKSAAIEFIQYRKGSSVYISAAVVTKESKLPTIIPIGKTDEILSIKLDNRMTVGKAILTESSIAKDRLYSNYYVMETIWNEELRDAIAGCNDIYFSADGFVHNLAVEFMFPRSDSPKLHRVTSTGRLAKSYSPVSIEDATALICGGMNFQTDIRSSQNPDNDYIAFNNLSRRGVSLKYLEGSKREIDSIKHIRHECKDSVLIGKAATEQTFREISGNYKIIHISSHGFYNGHLEIPEDELKPHLTDTTLSQSVIFFSGSERKLNSYQFDPVGYDDGIISARELSEMDLSNVSLCVLSACQTGLGNITADGVYGIQRGLKNAGAGAMLLSLWNVNDKAAEILMTKLYVHLAKGEDVRTAFYHAREDLSKKHTITFTRYNAGRMTRVTEKKEVDFSAPYYRNAFILIDDIR